MKKNFDNIMHPSPTIPSNRSFGITFACIFLIVSCWGLWVKLYWLAAAFAVAAIALLLVAVFWAGWLQPLNKAWHRFGILLARVMNPVIMAVIYFSLFLVTGLLMRLFNRSGNLFSLYGRKGVATAWRERDKTAVSDDYTKQY